MSIFYHKNILPDDVNLGDSIAIDTEAMGLNNHRDRLCLMQISNGNGDAHLIHFVSRKFNCSNIIKLLSDKNIEKIFHFARFDIAILQHSFGITIENVYCTKIASRLARTFTEFHSLKELCSELLGVKVSKQQQISDWGRENLTNDQKHYAANDVLYLHRIKKELDTMLTRENRLDFSRQCFKAIPTLARLDIEGWGGALFEYQ